MDFSSSHAIASKAFGAISFAARKASHPNNQDDGPVGIIDLCTRQGSSTQTHSCRGLHFKAYEICPSDAEEDKVMKLEKKPKGLVSDCLVGE